MPADSCATRYPILLVHGTGFRDRKVFGYWGRIPKLLEAEGASVFFGHQDSWGTVEHNARIVLASLQRIIEQTGCEKANIIAHSKGGIEARYLAASLQASGMIASITTVSAPHRGSRTMDWLYRIPSPLFRFASVFVNGWFRLLGDEKPDFYAACGQFTTAYMERFNRENPDCDGVYYQSFATVMKHPMSDVTMCIPSWIVGRIEGANDGLVTPDSAAWTNFRGVWRGSTARGISHADAVDLRRRPFTKKPAESGVSDIADCYLSVVRELKEMGL